MLVRCTQSYCRCGFQCLLRPAHSAFAPSRSATKLKRKEKVQAELPNAARARRSSISWSRQAYRWLRRGHGDVFACGSQKLFIRALFGQIPRVKPSEVATRRNPSTFDKASTAATDGGGLHAVGQRSAGAAQG